MIFKYFIKLTIFSFLFIGNIYAQSSDSLKTVVAKKGDGIYRILKQNGYPAKEYYNIFKKLNADKIGKDDSLLKGETYLLPELKEIVDDTTTVNCNKYFTDTILSKDLEGAVLFLISGHGGPDPGAVSKLNNKQISEDEYAYDITLRIAREINRHSGKVHMIINDPNDSIREDEYLPIDYDEYCYPDLEIPKNQNKRLAQRANAVNDIYKEDKTPKYQRVIIIHIDSRSKKDNVDVFFYHFPGSKKGKNSANTLQKMFAQKYKKFQPNRNYEGSVSPRNLMVIRKVLPPAVFIELGNIQNEKDRKRFINSDNRQALAKWITEGLIEDFKSYP